MSKIYLFFSLLLVTFIAKAHQVEVSTTMLVEKEDNTWFLQIRASLTAFQEEIKHNFKNSYKSPEEFKAMVLKHIKRNVQIIFDGNENVLLEDGFVKIGHEANVVFQLKNIPKEIKDVSVVNTSFSTIRKNKSGLVIFKDGFKKEHFVLNEANKHTINLRVKENTFEVSNTQKAGMFSLNKYLVLSFLLILPGFFYVEKNNNIPSDVEDQ